MDNEIADHLAEMMTGLGLSDVRISDQHEVTNRGEPDFERRITLWASVIATRGHQIVADRQFTEAERALAEQEFRDCAANRAARQELHLVAACAQK